MVFRWPGSFCEQRIRSPGNNKFNFASKYTVYLGQYYSVLMLLALMLLPPSLSAVSADEAEGFAGELYKLPLTRIHQHQVDRIFLSWLSHGD